MKRIIGKTIGLIGLAALIGFSAGAQTNSSFFSSVQSYFTSFNTNLDSTFQSKAQLWVGADSIQGGISPMANSIGLSYSIWKAVSVESVTRNAGVAGTVVSSQLGLGLSFVVHDAKITAYGDAGYAFAEPGQKFYGELGVRVQKALTEHTFALVGIAAQLPQNRQVLTVGAGFTF